MLKASFSIAKTLADLVKSSFKSLKVEDVNQILLAVDTSNKIYEQIRDQRCYILHYATKIKENFYYKIDNPSPFVFLSEDQYDETRTMISRKYHINPILGEGGQFDHSITYSVTIFLVQEPGSPKFLTLLLTIKVSIW